MPMCTYFNKQEIDAFREILTDKELLELLKEVNNRFDDRWTIREYDFVYRRGILGRKHIKKSFSIYYRLSQARHRAGMTEEYQIINFAIPDRDWSINGTAPKELVVNYLNGMISGYDYLARQRASAQKTPNF